MRSKNPRLLRHFGQSLALFLPFLFAVRAVSAEPPAAPVLANPGMVEWRVVDAAGQPIPGAVVWEQPPEMPDLYLGEVAPPPVVRTVSGDDGRFSIPAVVPFHTGFEICHDGYLARYLPAADGLPPIEIVLQHPARVSGQVLAPDGSPVRGAKLTARDPRWQPSDVVYLYEDHLPSNPCPGSTRDTTDAQGRFTLDLEPGSYDISAIAAGYRRSYVDRHFQLRPGEEAAGVEIHLVPGAVLRGRITTPTGDRVAGAEVSTDQDDSRTVTDSLGSFELAGLWTGRQTIRAVAQRDDILIRDASRQIEVAEGKNELDLILPLPGREVRGRVLAPDGTPLVGALLHPGSAARLDSCTGRRPRTAADGSFVVHLPAGTSRLVATHPGYSFGAVDLPAGVKPVTGAVIRLAPDIGVSVSILGWENVDGRERGWGIELDPAGEPRKRWLVGAIGPDGRYRFGGLPPGDWVVTANVEDHELTGRVKLTPGAEAHLEFALPPKLALHGRVVDERGEPVAGAKVKLRQGQGQGWEFAATSGVDGSFVVRLESGSWTAQVEWGGFAPTSEPVEVEGPTPRPVELVVNRGAVLWVRVHGVPAGQVVQGLGVSALKPSILQTGAGGVESGEEGLFRIAGLPPGDWRIGARIGPNPPLQDQHRPWRMEAAWQVTLGPKVRDLTVDVVLPQGGLTLSGRVGNSSRPLDIRLTRLENPKAEFFAYPATADEPFRFTGLPAGRYVLEALDPAWSGLISLAQQELELDGDREVVLELPHHG